MQDDLLPFADALRVEHIQQAFDDEGVSFGDADTGQDADSGPDADPAPEAGGLVYTMGVTLGAMLSQALFTGVQRSGRAAV